MTFVDPESLEDDENASKTIKTMKKLIKKAFPSLVEGKPWERLLVVPDALGKFESMTLEKNQTLPGLNNLWVSGGKGSGDLRNIGAAIQAATQVVPHLISEADNKTDATNLESKNTELTPPLP